MSNLQSKQSFTLMSFGGTVCQTRAFVYALMCGRNQFDCADVEFLAGCNRFGLDNPVPIITRRLAHYGNEEYLEKILEKCAKQFTDTNFLDVEKFGSIYPDKNAPRPIEGTTPGILSKA